MVIIITKGTVALHFIVIAGDIYYLRPNNRIRPTEWDVIDKLIAHDWMRG